MTIASVDNNQNNMIVQNNNERNLSDTKKKQGHSNTIFAGDLNIMQDKIGQHKAFANKQAMRTILGQFARDMRTDNKISQRETHIDCLKDQALSTLSELNQIEKDRNELKATYEISDDSNEYKDLELIGKAFKDGYGILSKEEREHLKDSYGINDSSDFNILKNGLLGETAKFSEKSFERFDEIMSSFSDYQNQAVSLYAREDSLNKQLYALNETIKAEDINLEGFKLELLKADPMVDAQKAAEDILEEASKNIIGMLTEEAVDHIEETQAEDKEKAEEQKEKLEEQQVEKEEKDTYYLEDMEHLQLSLNEYEKLQYKIKSEINMKQILEVDIKGVAVDEEA